MLPHERSFPVEAQLPAEAWQRDAQRVVDSAESVLWSEQGEHSIQ
jgi:hypothetical protein